MSARAFDRNIEYHAGCLALLLFGNPLGLPNARHRLHTRQANTTTALQLPEEEFNSTDPEQQFPSDFTGQILEARNLLPRNVQASLYNPATPKPRCHKVHMGM